MEWQVRGKAILIKKQKLTQFYLQNIRNALYVCMHYACKYQGAAMRSVFIETIEATGRAFFKPAAKVSNYFLFTS